MDTKILIGILIGMVLIAGIGTVIGHGNSENSDDSGMSDMAEMMENMMGDGNMRMSGMMNNGEMEEMMGNGDMENMMNSGMMNNSTPMMGMMMDNMEEMHEESMHSLS